MERVDVAKAEMRDRARGMLLGLACGDAVGTRVEFRTRGTFPPVTDMDGGGLFRLKPGQWTDDTSMALCLADSLLECGGFDAADQMRRYVQWYRQGYRSATDRCFDIGRTVRAALERFESTDEPFSGSTDSRSAGNGSIMRLAPVVIRWHTDRDSILHYAAESSKTTHAAEEAVAACELLGAILHALLSGQPPDAAISRDDLAERMPAGRLRGIALGEYREKDEGGIRGRGYVVDSLEAALWCFTRSADFEEAVLLATNLGDDADTTAAVCGQLAGAAWGESGIPRRWVERVYLSDEIRDLADALLDAG